MAIITVVFTEAFLKTWNAGNFNGNYKDLIDGIRGKVPKTQTPQLSVMVPIRTFCVGSRS